MTHRFDAIASVAAAVSLTAAAVLALDAQQQPTFRAGTRTVPVWATVNDSSGRFVVDLTRDEFEVRDDGKPQAITQFTTDAQPLSVVLLIDGSSSMTPMFKSVLEAANSFILRMLPADRTAIASFADRFQVRQPFTSNRDELIAHLRNEFNIRVGLETRLWEAITESAMALTAERGRRVVLVLSDGHNWIAPAPSAVVTPRGARPGSTFPVPSARGSTSTRTALAAAVDRDVMIYAVAMWTRFDGRDEAPAAALMNLAEHTGGGFLELRESDDINSAFTRIAQELHQQYILGFVPQALDGKTHRLEVRVKRPGMVVRARKGYLASAGSQ